MKLRLTYLLLIGLLFFKAYSFTAASNHIDVTSRSSVQKLFNSSSLCFNDCTNENVLSFSSLFIEDDNDDDDSYDKKKVACSSDTILSGNAVVIIYLHNSFKNYISFANYSEYSFPHRYIFIRSIRV